MNNTRVRCYLCEYENVGTCSKKLQNGKPIKVKLNKSRKCRAFSSDSEKVKIEAEKREVASKIPLLVPTYRYHLSNKERKEQGVTGPLFVRKY